MGRVLGDNNPVERWEAPWEFEAWKEALLQGDELSTSFIAKLYTEQWDPYKAREIILRGRWFVSQQVPVGRRRVRLDMRDVERRIAKAIWIECNRLMSRNMLPDARAYVIKMQEQAQVAAAIIVG